MNDNEVIYIKTIDELKNYSNKLLVCYYYRDYQKEQTDHNLDRPNEPEEKIAFMWIMRYDSMPTQMFTDNPIRGKTLSFKDNYVCLIDNIRPNTITPCLEKFHGRECSAQAYIRTPTKKEMNIYMNLLRHKRIFGT